MPNVEHHPEQLRMASGPVNVSDKAVLIGAGDNGFVVSSFNMSPNMENGGARKKIPGESVVYDNTDGDTGFINLGSAVIDGKLVELWGGDTEGVVRIDGLIAARNADIPLRNTDAVDFDYSDNATGGEIYITNKRTTPFVYSIGDMSLSIGTDKYLSEYVHDLYTINIKTPLSRPRFKGLKFVTQGSGLPTGSVSYSMRYVNEFGDSTTWSQETPVIPVPRNYSLKTNSYPTNQYQGSQVFGDFANSESPTGIGVELALRVVNDFGFDFIEVKRVLRKDGAGPKYTPPGEIVFRQPIEDGQVGVIKFVDGQDNNVDSTPVSAVSDLKYFSEIKSCEAIVYKDRRVHLFGITYESRDISSVTFKSSPSGNKAYPWIHNMEFQGHSDPYNAAYFKSYPRGERCSFGIVCHSAIGGKSLALKDDALINFKFPERREAVNADTISRCESNGRGVSFTPGLSGTTATHTHEVFEMQRAVDRYHQDVKNIITNSGSATGSSTYSDVDDAGYKPFRPYRPGDPDVSDHSFRPIDKVDDGSGTTNYNPDGFRPDYFSLGLGIEGIQNLPSWAKAVSIVRTEAAGRVVAQGLGMYSLYRLGSGSASPLRKYRDKFWFYSSDIFTGGVSQAIIDDIQRNPNQYKVQFVSPLGFFTDVYSGDRSGSAVAENMDLISFARIIYDGTNINPGIAASSYVTWGKWMNGTYASNDIYTSADKIFDINDINSIVEGRNSYFEIDIDGNVYDKEFINSSDATGSTSADNFLEPFYIVNIIKDDSVCQDNDITEYRPTGTYILLESLIGVSSGNEEQEFELVDERWEDCCVNPYDSAPENEDVFVWVDSGDGVKKAWIDVTFKDAVQRATILSAINTSGSYTSGSTDVYGVYTHTNENDRDFAIRFGVVDAVYDTAYQIPAEGARIYVMYDNTRPISVFGGDCFIGESIFSPIDKETHSGGSGVQKNGFKMNAPLPFKEWEFAEDYIIPKNAAGGFATDNVQNLKTVELGSVRQWAMMFCSESRIAVPYKNGNVFPSVHYVMRPQEWDNTDMKTNFAEDGEGGCIYAQYRKDYPDEETFWGYGGFRTIEEINGDYSAWLGERFYSIPDSGYNEVLEFSTRDHYSAQRQINKSASATIKTFPPLNIKDFDDSFGPITSAFKIDSPQSGFDVYITTKLGMALVPISKTQVQDASGQSKFLSLSDNIVGKEIWRSSTIGLPRGYVNTLSVWKNKAFFLNDQNAFLFNGQELAPIGGKIYPLIKEKLNYGNPDYFPDVMAGYFPERKEWWVKLNSTTRGGGPAIVPRLAVFCDNENAQSIYQGWIGEYSYADYDQFLGANGRMYGFKNMQTWRLFDPGSSLISGAPITSYIDIPFSKELNIDKEFIRVGVSSEGVKPTIVRFYLDGVPVCSVPASSLKEYGSIFEQYIPRQDVSVSPNRHRVQSDLLVVRVEHSEEADFEVESVYLQYKQII